MKLYAFLRLPQQEEQDSRDMGSVPELIQK